MNTLQIARRLLRHCQPRDLSALSLDQRQEVLGAIISGTGQYFAIAPVEMRRTTASYLIAAPTTVSIEVTHGSAVVASGTPFTAMQRGCTIQIGSDARLNEIVSTTGFLDAWPGESGIVTATIYGDAIPIHDRQVERLLSDPILVLANGGSRRLTKVSLDHDIARVSDGAGDISTPTYSGGEPTRYAIQRGGVSRASDLNMSIRLWPLPSAAATARFEMLASPEAWGLETLEDTPEDLPLSNEHLERLVLPLCEEVMLTSSMWKADDAVTRRIETAAARARQQLPLIAATSGRPRGRIRTRPGF